VVDGVTYDENCPIGMYCALVVDCTQGYTC
jgi:hypothetical protein